jgi:HlyD family type I secretion membrane fusion protein
LRPLFERKLVPLTRISGLEREKLRLEGVIAGARVTLTKLDERIEEIKLRLEQTRQDYRQEASGLLPDVRKAINDSRQQLLVADDAQKRVDVRSPNDGQVQQLRIFTIGGVLRPGDPILDLVPLSDQLVVRAKVSPLDADRVRAGMKAEIRFPSFRTLYLPIINGEVRHISSDRVMDEVTRDFYFAAEVAVNKDNVPPEIREKVSAGIPADVIIPTGTHVSCAAHHRAVS